MPIIYTRKYCSCGGKLAYDDNVHMNVCSKCNKRYVSLEVKEQKNLLSKYKEEIYVITQTGLK